MTATIERVDFQTNGQTRPDAEYSEYLSYEEFLELAEGKHAEWVDGKMMLLMSASDEHQDFQRWLLKLVDTWVEVHDLGIVRGAPFQMKMENRPSGREPDILFVAKENQSRVKKNYLDGPADLVIEIVSPESIARDRGDKFVEYEAAAVPEYWLIDPQRKQAEWYQLDDTGIYRSIAPDAQGIYRSREVKGLWLREAWLWQKPMPKLLDVLREWELI